MIDFKMTDDFDLSFSQNGDFNTVSTIETAIPCALFLEKRDEDATQSFILAKIDGAKGHFGMGDSEGSLIWKLYQSRLSTNVLNEARLFADDGLSFLATDEIVDDVSVESTTDGQAIILNMNIQQENSIIERRFTL
jgi:phage gp46-like protein